ncbi:DNA-directed DNA polymerase [Malassezia caprae]|uniref:DNA polymerase epsilon subunit n=1 Tax=Malassezia caprae TaxID=1381934 RepID=A0AAF0E494_9BASI|nr:DNA-directed DNA polymerase [Malassezia caprae]
MDAGRARVPPDVRRRILRAFTRKRHLQLQSDAVQFVYETLEAHDLLRDAGATDEALDALAGALVDQHVAGSHSHEFDGHVVSRDALQKVYDQLLVEAADDGATAGGALTQGEAPDMGHFFRVCDAFSQPRISFHGARKVFEVLDNASLLAGARAPSMHHIERYELLRSIVLRNEHFLPALTGPAQRDAFLRLSTTKHLLGRQGAPCLLFGRLSTAPDGTYTLEDTDGSVPLDLSRAVAGEGLFTEGAYVLVEGQYTPQETLQVLALGHPPSEPRESARALTGHLDWLGTGAIPPKHVPGLRAQELQHTDVCIAVFSDVFLNEPSTLSRLKAILQGYEDADFLPLAIVLCGHFSSAPLEADGALAAYADSFAQLGDLLAQCPRVLAACHLVFVPGPHDPAATGVLPRPRLPAPIAERLEARLPPSAQVHWMSNPCRLVYYSQEVVVFRDDLLRKMLRHAVLLRDDLSAADMPKFLVSTLLDQAHLCPLPPLVRPILWEYAHALRLYPMPSAVRLCSDTARACRSV